MKPMWWMVGSSLLSWLVVAALPWLDSDREVLLGMLAPLIGAVTTWVLVVRTYASRPERLTSLMVAAFGGKLVFFVVYVTAMLTTLSLRPLPFVVSFTTYFIALYMVEALCLQRLFAVGMPGPLRGTRPTYVGRVPPKADPPGR